VVRVRVLEFFLKYFYQLWVITKTIGLGVVVRVYVINATFNNISAISWRQVLLVEESGENHRPGDLS